jgi:hypothetical protein
MADEYSNADSTYDDVYDYTNIDNASSGTSASDNNSKDITTGYYTDQDGNLFFNGELYRAADVPESKEELEALYGKDSALQKNNPSFNSLVAAAVNKLGDLGKNFVKKYVVDDKGNFNVAGIAAATLALKSLSGGNTAQGKAYQGEIPKLQAVRSKINYQDINRRPGETGRQYFTGTHYVTPTNAASNQTMAENEATGIAGLSRAQQLVKPAQQAPASFAMPFNQPAPTQQQTFAKGGRYLDGSTDGMADKIPSTIDGHQKAALSHGEFVIPADVVSHLGNGNSNAGAQKLYDMMARVRKARTGNQHQGKQINPDKFLGGGIAAQYADGGNIQPDYYGPNFVSEVNEKGEKNYESQAVVNSTGTTGTGTGTTATTSIPIQGKSQAEGLSSWAGPYVSNMLGKGEAISNTPYESYEGPLTAGASDLQEQQFGGLSQLASTGFTPGQNNYQAFNANAAKQYMNPYTQTALDPQIKELQRQGQIQNLQNQGQATKMGAFGGSGSALMQTEGQRNTLDKVQSALGQGYNTAYNNATQQFNADQARQQQNAQQNEANRQFSANYGLQTLQNLGAAGATQRDIEQQGITADKAQFEEERDNPSKQVQFQKSLLTGLPITTTDNTNIQSQIGNISNQIAGLASLYQTIKGLGV